MCRATAHGARSGTRPTATSPTQRGGAQTEMFTYYDGAFVGRAGRAHARPSHAHDMAVGGTSAHRHLASASNKRRRKVNRLDGPNCTTPGDMTSHRRTYGYDTDGTAPILFRYRPQIPRSSANSAMTSASMADLVDRLDTVAAKVSGENASAYEYDHRRPPRSRPIRRPAIRR